MTLAGMTLLTIFALVAALCLWLYWRERVRFAVAAIGMRALEREGLIAVEWTPAGDALVHSTFERQTACPHCGSTWISVADATNPRHDDTPPTRERAD